MAYVINVKELPIGEQPREKLLGFGPSALDLEELVAIILGSGTRGEDVITMSRRIVGQYGSVSLSDITDPAKFSKALGLPITKCMQIVAAIELG
jgi:DNA repair protein RadC